VTSSTLGFILMVETVSERWFMWPPDAAVSARFVYPMEQS